MDKKDLTSLGGEVSPSPMAEGEMSTDEQEDYLKRKGWEGLYLTGGFLKWREPGSRKNPNSETIYTTDDAVALQKKRDNDRFNNGMSA
jgi:hypothetical protein